MFPKMKTRITAINQHKLNLWLEKHKDIAAFASNAQLAERARLELGFAITECNIRSTRKTVGAKRLYFPIPTKPTEGVQ